MSFSINYLLFCVPTLHINDYRNRDIVLNALIAELITLGVKHRMAGKVPKSKDFYKVPLCSNTIVSTCGVLGNMSNGITVFTSYKSINSFKFFPSVAGLQEIYTICFG